jgi:hypothetical protein
MGLVYGALYDFRGIPAALLVLAVAGCAMSADNGSLEWLDVEKEYAEIEVLLDEPAGYVFPRSDVARLTEYIEKLYTRASYLEYCMREEEMPNESGWGSFMNAYEAAKEGSPKKEDTGVS